ncbi:MAG: hypothetical protein DWQ40_05055 [Actinobacteria bacterium]|nr:MAG: hypothetical protein DWQ40_05055 [Actinomycetota bacterium]
MLRARADAWEFLTGHYASQPQPWSTFYSDRRETDFDRRPYWDAHDSLVMVASEWALLGVLYEEERVDEELARRLFSHQYRSWAVAFRFVRDVTVSAGETPPTWSALLETLDANLLDPNEPRPAVLRTSQDLADTSPDRSSQN